MFRLWQNTLVKTPANLVAGTGSNRGPIQKPEARGQMPEEYQFFCFSELVEVNGIEPMASCVQGRRSPS
jgi:hypothetical protein